MAFFFETVNRSLCLFFLLFSVLIGVCRICAAFSEVHDCSTKFGVCNTLVTQS